MSYILDALKKSEQDRGNGSIPNVQTIHSSSLNYQQEKRSLWPWILIAVLVINVFILIYFLNPTSTNHIEPDSSSLTSSPPSYQKEPVIKSAPPAISPPVTKLENSVSTIPETTAPEPLTLKPKTVISIDELPENVRQHIPDMVFSAHVFSSTPAQRSLVINGRFMEEGEAFSHDLILVEITRNGAIFDFRGYRFRTSVLSGWSTH